MAYRDPYAGQYGGSSGPQRQYTTEDSFNPYEQPRYNTYDQGGPSYGGYNNNHYGGPPPPAKSQPYNAPYTDEPLPEREDEYYNQAGMQRQNTHVSQRSVPKSEGERSGFDHGEFNSPRGAYSSHDNLWTKGSKPRCIGRFCCCTLLIILLLLVSIIGPFALWIRPPAVVIGDVEAVAKDGSVVQVQNNGIVVNLGINISVTNPNFFSVNFQKLQADLIYPINDTPIGGGNATDIVFPSHTKKDYTFPLKIEYSTSDDAAILVDLAQKCGLLGTKTSINIKYEITVGIKVLFFTVSPVISNSVNIDCPFDGSDLSGLLGGSAGSILGG